MIAIVILVSLALLFVVYSARTRKESESPSRHATPEELAYAAKRLRQGDAKNALAFQKALEDKFLASSTTRRIIDAIGDGTGRLPEEIAVYDDRVTGCTDGRTWTFGFAANRVPLLNKVYTIEGKFVKTAHNPKEALARAIDRILGGQYNIEHSSPSHVLLRLKPTTPW